MDLGKAFQIPYKKFYFFSSEWLRGSSSRSFPHPATRKVSQAEDETKYSEPPRCSRVVRKEATSARGVIKDVPGAPWERAAHERDFISEVRLQVGGFTPRGSECG